MKPIFLATDKAEKQLLIEKEREEEKRCILRERLRLKIGFKDTWPMSF